MEVLDRVTEKSAIETAKAIRAGETTAMLECEAAIARIGTAIVQPR